MSLFMLHDGGVGSWIWRKDAKGVTEQNPGQLPGDCCKEKKGVDWDWRTTIGYSLVLLWYHSPMVQSLPGALPQALLYSPFGAGAEETSYISDLLSGY